MLFTMCPQIYGMTFPIITIEDMASAMFLLLDNLGVRKVRKSAGKNVCLKVIYHPLYGMNNDVFIWGD